MSKTLDELVGDVAECVRQRAYFDWPSLHPWSEESFRHAQIFERRERQARAALTAYVEGLKRLLALIWEEMPEEDELQVFDDSYGGLHVKLVSIRKSTYDALAALQETGSE